MIYPLALILITLIDPFDSNFELPNTWEKDFTISLSYTGSMDGSYFEAKLTHDSCTYKRYTRMNKNGEVRKSFAVGKKERTEILEKMREWKVNEIKSESSTRATYDGWQQSICFNFNCISGGSSTEMTVEDKNRFLDAYRYLENFVLTSGK
ncbi:MAG: hypothetical protein K2U26_11200 [Cyclobacteriaceae bacterium]|nr:hypothetical protein [Cyclobacteriaceae bacterium]